VKKVYKEKRREISSNDIIVLAVNEPLGPLRHGSNGSAHGIHPYIAFTFSVAEEVNLFAIGEGKLEAIFDTVFLRHFMVVALVRALWRAENQPTVGSQSDRLGKINCCTGS
jgi:hypothetical protein